MMKQGKPIAFCEIMSLEPKEKTAVHEISQELAGKYYNIMYGKHREK